ncbi:MAG: hypothetical protein HRU41_40940 [Saprospiraceae bacterium]|nr:hypothetical protein [Saprospiraceae bacterium]
MPKKLKALDRNDSIADSRKRLEEDKVLRGDENLSKLLLIKLENQEFLTFLDSFRKEDQTLERLDEIFQSHRCLGCSVLQNKFVPEFLTNLIDKIEDEEIKLKVLQRFNRYLEVVEKNRVRQLEKVNSGSQVFEIDRATITFFGFSNFQIINGLNKVGYEFELGYEDNGDLRLSFETGEKNLKIMDIILLATNRNYKIPLSKIGLFKK